jgi:hypothetical protein
VSLTRRKDEKATCNWIVMHGAIRRLRGVDFDLCAESPHFTTNQLGAAGSDGVRPFVQLAVSMLARHKKMNTNIVVKLVGKEESKMVQKLRMPAIDPEVVQRTIRYRNGMIATLVRDISRNRALKAE